MNRVARLVSFLLCSSMSWSCFAGGSSLCAAFSDGMVLQSDAPVPVWSAG